MLRYDVWSKPSLMHAQQHSNGCVVTTTNQCRCHPDEARLEVVMDLSFFLQNVRVGLKRIRLKFSFFKKKYLRAKVSYERTHEF